ncbi:type IV pilus assembly protein FimV [Variovorax sp. ZT4R33]|uniref:type IV pilus assembly protein FimV n=1 Tax=Variovorax sp. ZT4R33 TaxID=3443743 RepID=UPI003F4603AA
MQLLRRTTPLFLLGFAIPAAALTLGPPQGAVWIGRPLDLIVPVTLADGEGGESLCAEAEVMQGNARVDDRRVTVSLEPGTRPGQTRMHVRSTVAVEEPVIQITVRAGCQASSTRQFVLFADMPVEPASPPVLPGLPRAVPSASSVGAPVAAERRAAPRTRVGGSAAAPTTSAPAARAAASRPAAAPRAPAASTPAPASPASSGPRLQLDALDPAAVRNPAIAASGALANPEAAAAAAAALAARAAANTEELQRANDRMKALEATLASLREQSAQNQRLLMEMRSELADARDSRYRNPLVYVLCLLLLLTLIGLVLLWRVARRASGPAWWGDAGVKDDAMARPPPAPVGGGMPFAGGSAALKTGPFGTPFVGIDEGNEGNEGNEAAETLPPLTEDDSTPTRYVNTEELFDVQQQSDFFVSLGQHDQAIAVLSEHIADNPETSALAYLDLLRIYHSLDRRDDYARVGQEFERAFNASVPDFDHFSEVGRGLEHYPSTLARIEAQWPRTGTLGLIEELVFRKPELQGDESFDLAAYRELLLLYSVAKEVIDPDSAPPTPITPLSFLDTRDAKLEPTQPLPLDHPAESGARPEDHNAPDAPLPSLYGAIDETLAHDTVIAAHPGAVNANANANATASSSNDDPRARAVPRPEARERAGEDDALSFDNTSLETLETLPGELEPEKRFTASPTTEEMPLPDLRLDLELFDPTIEAEIAPRPRRRR